MTESNNESKIRANWKWKIKGMDHVGIAVNNLAEATTTFVKNFNLPLRNVAESKEQGLKFGLIETGNCVVELMEPTDQDGTVARFLYRNGGRNSIHHLAFAVDSRLEQVADDLKALGVEMTYPKPRTGVMGHPINFCHPKFTSNILIELCDVDYQQN